MDSFEESLELTIGNDAVDREDIYRIPEDEASNACSMNGGCVVS